MTLRSRVLIGSAVIAVVLAMGALAIIRITERHLVAQVDERLARAELDDLNLGPGPRDDRRYSFSEFYGGLIRHGVFELTATPDLERKGLTEPVLDVGRAIDGAKGGGDSYTVPSLDGESSYRVRAVETQFADVYAVLALPLEDVDDAVGRLQLVAGATTASVLGVVALVAWWVVHLGVRPIRQMTTTASAIAAGDLSQRVPAGTPGTEAGDLGVALNTMLGTIEDAFDERTRSEERLRRFIADASHELRTPVTTVRGYAELYRAGGLRDADELREAMRRTEQESVRMGGLIDDMLQLARLDQGRPLERGPVDLSALAADAVRDAAAVAPDRSITCSANGPLVVSGDEDRLRQVVANLLGNALVHTEPGTPVDVRVDAVDGRARLDVIDHGAGMPPDVAARAFERFYRADPSRSRHRGGSGLGLSIVQSVVRAHGGTATIESEPGRGTTVRVEVPLAVDPLDAR